MNKIVIIGLVASILAVNACSFHAKQPTSDEYYKRTQSVAWPDM